MAEQHRKPVEFAEWHRGCLPGAKGIPPMPANRAKGVWLRRAARGRRVHFLKKPGDWLSDAEAAAVLGITRQTVQNWRRNKKIKSRKRAGTWQFAFSEVRDKYCELNGLPYSGRTTSVEDREMLDQTMDDLIAENDELRAGLLEVRGQLNQLLARWEIEDQERDDEDDEEDEDPEHD